MIPTSTRVKVDISPRVPGGAAAVALLMPTGQSPWSLEQLDPQGRRAVSALIAAKAAPAKSREVVAQVLSDSSHARLLLVGLGEAEKIDLQTMREAGAALAKSARRQGISNVALLVPQKLPKSNGAIPLVDAIGALVLGFLLRSYRFEEFKGAASKGESGKTPSQVKLTVVTPDHNAGIADAIRRATLVAEGQNLTRTIASRPGNVINPPALAQISKDLAAEVGLNCRIIDDKELAKLGAGGILAAGSGSATPPRFIVLEHRPAASRGKAASKREAPVLLVGKSITFDTGGISIKPAEKMGDMVYDKCGGMAVLGTMVTLARLKYPRPVVAILSAAENHVSGRSYRPGDIIRLYNGVTVEVTNTDAEGRLVLADAIAWGIETFKPSAVVDLATLTGGCVVALGHTMAGLMSNDDDLAAELLKAAAEAGEKVWRLPVGEDQREMIKSHHADIVNSAGRWGSPLTGAAFVSFALPDKPKMRWAHFDIAGVADTDKELPLYDRGATGWGVRTLLSWLESRA